jgi:predicted amidohydrolase YtcJ
MEKAIELYTLESAYAEFMEGRKGMVKPGYLADLLIMEKDLLTIPASEIMKTRVDVTIVGGKVVCRRVGS